MPEKAVNSSTSWPSGVLRIRSRLACCIGIGYLPHDRRGLPAARFLTPQDAPTRCSFTFAFGSLTRSSCRASAAAEATSVGCRSADYFSPSSTFQVISTLPFLLPFSSYST